MKTALKSVLFASLIVSCGLLAISSYALDPDPATVPEATPAAGGSSQVEEVAPEGDTAVAVEELGQSLFVFLTEMQPILHEAADVCSSDSHTECIGKKNGDECGRMKICVMSEGSRDCLCHDT